MEQLYYYYGSMSCGKSSNLLQTAYNWQARGHQVLYFTSALDDRSGVGMIKSRIGLEHVAQAVGEDGAALHNALSEIKLNPEIKAIFVDECQFLSAKCIDILAEIVDNTDCTVYCYGIRTDFNGKLFSGSERLFEIADVINELETICDCGNKATMNARLVYSTEKVLIGGDDMYKSMCRKCFNKWNKQNEI